MLNPNSQQEEEPIYSEKPVTQISEEVLKDIERKLTTWFRMANLLHGLVITLGITAIGCSLFITAFAGSDFLGQNNTTIRILAFITTLCLTIITSFNLPNKANRCRSAWRHLNKSLYRYKSKVIDGNALIKAYDEGENILGTVDFNYNNNNNK